MTNTTMANTTMARRVRLVEVSPRDGLQNEPMPVPTAIKVELVERLIAAGCAEVEVASFVSPQRVPQMADGADVLAAIVRRPGTVLSALVPNLRGFEAALAARVDEVVVFGAASETFSRRNIGCSITESIARFEPVARAARVAGIRLRGSVSCALGCPFEGEVAPAAVADVVARLVALGCDTIDIADTIGVGTPRQVEAVIEAAVRACPIDQLAGHFHDTHGQALVNVHAAFQCGVSIFHGSVAGLGGCPFAPGATGNVATEDLAFLFRGLGIDTGVDLDALVDTGQWIASRLGRPSASRAGNALAARRERTSSETAIRAGRDAGHGGDHGAVRVTASGGETAAPPSGWGR